MQPTDLSRALMAATSTATALGLTVDDVEVLQNSNKLAVRLRPCDVLARIAPLADHAAQFEVDLAVRLAETASPAVALEPRVPTNVYDVDGFAITFWTYHPLIAPDIAPSEYGDGLRRLHIGMRKIDITTPHFTDRVTEAERLLANRNQTPELPDVDRVFLSGMLNSLKSSILGHGAAEQLLHGEPHPGNVLNTKYGPLFIDLETCCHGPIEFDLAHVPEAVIDHYPNVDQVLLGECRALVLVMVAAWRWDAGDQFPHGRHWAEELIRALRRGPPWPSLDAIARDLAGAQP